MEDHVVNRLKRGAAELGIDLIDVRTTEEERELIEHCNLPDTLQTKGKLRRTIRELQRPPVYLVSARVKNAVNSHGARGNAYKLLERYGGCYSEAESKQVVYDGDDLMVKAYFWDRRGAMEFQTAMNNWEIHKALVNLDGIEIIPRDPLPVPQPADLTRFFLQDYTPNDSESPCDGLDQLESYRFSNPVTEAVEFNDPISIYQSLDVCVGRNKPYKCHLKDKAKFKSIARNENNILAASWHLHQMLDGLNHEDSMSVVKLSVTSTSEYRISTKDNRYAVVLQLEFFNQVDAAAFQPQTGASKIDDKTWRTTVYIKNKTEFTEFVRWKGEDTEEQW
eukprot:CAMPEP_0202477432 /NCGR_PEP_ID=MMETSP1360-20130828/93940_1 /ASSEMBLY_ACC=CAM_ASM_000848 /TAXON_ID=515479 /ORGANISM="Licmophora paradoxa, Strain CCMP2313" /LENGTH=334 /DNA_ID=CAMNT_0049104677 /DNA_START=59 /DNA_END=1060 /DNA_ORIENTATION=+